MFIVILFVGKEISSMRNGVFLEIYINFICILLLYYKVLFNLFALAKIFFDGNFYASVVGDFSVKNTLWIESSWLIFYLVTVH